MMKANLRKQGEKQGETVVLYMNGAQSRHLHQLKNASYYEDPLSRHCEGEARSNPRKPL